MPGILLYDKVVKIYFNKPHLERSETVEVRYTFMDIYLARVVIYSIPSVSALGNAGTRFASRAALPRCR